MRRPFHYSLRLDGKNPILPLSDHYGEIMEEADSEPQLRAILLDRDTNTARWIFLLSSTRGYQLMPAGSKGEEIEEAVMPCSVVTHLMVEHLFGLFLCDEEGDALTRSACQTHVELYLARLGYHPTNKFV